jgi:hypothetical protein
MSCRRVPPIYGPADKFYDEEGLRKMLNLSDQDTCADYYVHYRICIWAVIECKSRHLRNSLIQLSETTRKLLDSGKPVDKVIIVADTLGREKIYKRRDHILYKNKGNNVKLIEIEGIPVEAWQPEEIRNQISLNEYLE